MKNQELEIQTNLQIQKPAEEIYEAIVDPEKMKNYFISGSSGRMEEGSTVIWKFPEFEEETSVRIDKVQPRKYIAFNWEIEGRIHLVEIKLIPKENKSTLVTVSETGAENNAAGIHWLKQNTEGWANFLACLKAYLEYGINLRKGAFDFMKQI